MNFEAEYRRRSERIGDIIEKYLPGEQGFQKTLLEAMNYAMLAGGKRLRPMLMMETYECFGGSGEVIEPFMAAMEMIHTHSLIHDDLPAMDNDEYRRGRKTTHVVFGEAMGILAGDGLLNYAYETVAKAFAMGDHTDAVAKAFGVLAEKTGILGMIGGQSVDVENEGKPLTTEQLDFIYRLKTGALIEASMMTGAILAGATGEQTDRICGIAGDIGLAFQIEDDILDVTGTAEVLGKPIKSDEKNHKTTYVTIRGLEQARRDVEEISGRALLGIREFGWGGTFLEELVRQLIYRTS